jgi:hypothetical protein
VERARPATAADEGVLRVLTDTARAELVGQRGGALLAGSTTIEDLVAAAGRDPDRIVVVGTIDEAEVGFASAHCDRTRSQPSARP